MLEMMERYPWEQELSEIAGEHVHIWGEHLDALQSQESNAWLCLAGGLPMGNAASVFDMAALAQCAPNDLLFGLAYGKIADALAYPQHHGIHTPRGRPSVVEFAMTKSVLRRGSQMLAQMADTSPEFARNMTEYGSRTQYETLLEQAQMSPDAHCLGQLTSWLCAAHASGSAAHKDKHQDDCRAKSKLSN